MGIKQGLSPYIKDKDGYDVLALADRDTSQPYFAALLRKCIRYHEGKQGQCGGGICCAEEKLKNSVPESATIGASNHKKDLDAGGGVVDLEMGSVVNGGSARIVDDGKLLND